MNDIISIKVKVDTDTRPVINCYIINFLLAK